MRNPPRKFVFEHVYEMAALVEGSIDEYWFNELDWEDPELLRGLGKFSTTTLLARYIYTCITITHRHEFRDKRYEYEAEDVTSIESLFDAYEVPHHTFAAFASSMAPTVAASPLGETFYQWFRTEEPSFELLWEKSTDEVLHLLFGNRAFLLKFNLAVAGYLRSHKLPIPPECLGSDGNIARRPLPIWVRDAVFYRDHGRCVLCQVDLSGLLSPDRVDHFDHMVPLAAWGTNDVCNIQLLCEACNLRKAAGEPITGHRYTAWWAY